MNEDEWEEIHQRFSEEGVDINLPDNRKLLYVWRWLVDAETNCISLRHQLDKLSRRQADEVKEIRTCMEQMCKSWEIKVCSLEEENERFQEQLDRNDQNAGKIVSKEIQQMLLEDGLPEISNLGVTEQFAYLLVERTRMKAELEQELERRRKREQAACMASNLPDSLKLSSPQVQRILERQKDEYEEELRHQQQTMKYVKEQLKQVHEDELNRLNADKEHLTNELSEARQKIEEIVAHIASQQGKDICLPWIQHVLEGKFEQEVKDLEAERDQLRLRCQEQQKQFREQGETLRIVERSSKQLELDNETLAYKLSEALAQFDELEDQLRREKARGRRDSLFKQLSSKDSPNMKNNINKYLDNRSSQEMLLIDQIKKLKAEVSNLQEQLEALNKRLEIITIKYQQRKERHRERIHRLRDIQDREHKEWKERMEGFEKELALTRDLLSREQEWRVKVEADCRKLQNDNQLLQTGIIEKEKSEREKAFDMAVLHREVEMLKAVSTRPHNQTGSPLRRNSVWPVLTHPKKW